MIEPFESNFVRTQSVALTDTQTNMVTAAATQYTQVSNSSLSANNIIGYINTGSSLLNSINQNIGTDINVLNANVITTTSRSVNNPLDKDILPTNYIPSTDIKGVSVEKTTSKVYQYKPEGKVIIINNNNTKLIIGGLFLVIIIFLIVYFFIL
jgi:hypothetical protein